MPRKTRTFVPYRLEVDSNPKATFVASRKVTLRVLGKDRKVIARIVIGSKAVEVYGAREFNPQRWTYEELQLEGASV